MTTATKPLLNLDGTNLAWHADRVQAWEAGERIAPVSIDMALTRACQAACRGCIDADQLVTMADGTLRPIRLVRRGDEVMSLRGGTFGPATVSAAWMTDPAAALLEIVMEHGILRCTRDHPILTRFGWVEAQDLPVGDYVAAQNNLRGAGRISGTNEGVQRHAQGFGGNQAQTGRGIAARVGEGDARRTAPAWRGLPQDQRRPERAAATVGADEAAARRGQDSEGAGRSAVVSLEEPAKATPAPRSSDGGWQAQVVRAYAPAEPHEEPRSRSACLRDDAAEALGRRLPSCPVHSRSRAEQGRAHRGRLAGTVGFSIRGRRRVLDRSMQERQPAQPGLHLPERQEQGRRSVSLNILAYEEPGSGTGRSSGLRACRLADVRDMGRHDGQPGGNSGVSEGLAGWSRVLGVQAAGAGPVYDLTIEGAHNFVAAGVVVHNCYAVLQEPHERANVSVNAALMFADDAAEIGVRAVSIVSDGESTLSPAYVPFIERLHSNGLDVGNATNGWRLFPDVAEQVLPKLKWVRFTVLAGKPKQFAEMMLGDASRTDLYWTAMHNISEAVKIKRRRKLDVTLGIQTFVTPKDRDSILDFARLGVDLGVDYVVIKHMSDDEYGSYGIKYEDYDQITDALKEAETLATDQTQVIVKWSKIKDGNKPPYKRFYGPPFLLQVSGSGLVAPSGMFFNSRYAKLWIGNFTDERFRDIWKSQRYWDCMEYLASSRFDAGTMLGALPIQHYASVALDRHVKGIERITAPAEGTPRPEHWRFV